MKKPIYNACQKFDEVVMYGVNKGVKAWNWTFGKTKADLANYLLTVAPVFEGVGFMMDGTSVAGAALTIAYLAMSHYSQKRNKEQEEREKKVSMDGVMIAKDDYNNTRNVMLGYGFAGLSATEISAASPDMVTLGVGQGIRAASHYVMRADYLPPGKNRAKDKLEDLVEKTKIRNLEPAFSRMKLFP